MLIIFLDKFTVEYAKICKTIPEGYTTITRTPKGLLVLLVDTGTAGTVPESTYWECLQQPRIQTQRHTEH